MRATYAYVYCSSQDFASDTQAEVAVMLLKHDLAKRKAKGGTVLLVAIQTDADQVDLGPILEALR